LRRGSVRLRSNPTAKQNQRTFRNQPKAASSSHLGGRSAARAWLLFAAVGLSFGLGGCSFSIPLGSFTKDDDTTGSIKANASPFLPDLDPQDWRIAEPILAQALRSGEPQTAVHWSNADSGHSGAFQPVAGSFSRGGKSCRAFVARLNVVDGTKMVQALGCPDDGGRVAVDDVKPWKGI
jgi:17 kDa outer membrane surface antigen